MAKLTTYQVTEIAKDTWVINEAGMTAMFLLKGTERALLIDTGVGMTDLKKLISWLTPLPYDVVLTHGHPDHIGGAAQFEEVYILTDAYRCIHDAMIHGTNERHSRISHMAIKIAVKFTFIGLDFIQSSQ